MQATTTSPTRRRARKPLQYQILDVKTAQEQMTLLWSKVDQGTGHPRLRQHLAELMAAKGIPARDPVALTRAVQEFNQQRLKYLREYPETYASPERTLQWGVGDCDDFTILTCAALRGVKIPCRAVFVGWAPKETAGPIPFKHVYPEAFLNGRWVAVESVKPVPLGWAADVNKQREGYRIRRATIGDTSTKFSAGDGTEFDVDVPDARARAIGLNFGQGLIDSGLPAKLGAGLNTGLADTRATGRTIAKWAIGGLLGYGLLQVFGGHAR